MIRLTEFLLKNFNAISAREVNDQKDNKDNKKANDSIFFRDHQMLQRTTHKVAIPKKIQIAWNVESRDKAQEKTKALQSQISKIIEQLAATNFT